MNDLIGLAMRRAADKFGHPTDFNAANFSQAFIKMAGVQSNLDGHVVQAMLCGRPDVKVLDGGCHFRRVDS